MLRTINNHMSKRSRSKNQNHKKRGGDLNAIGQEVYEGTASLGRFMAWVGLVVGGFISLILIVIGLVILIKKDNHSAKTVAKVKAAECKANTDNRGATTISCQLTITYNVDGKEYEKQMSTTGKMVNKEDTMEIRYDPSNPDNFTDSNRKVVGWILLCIGLIILGVSIFQWYVATRYKMGAAAHGVGAFVDIVK